MKTEKEYNASNDDQLLEKALIYIDELHENLVNMKTEITKESLLKFGMVLTEDPVCPMHKKLETGGDSEVSIAVTRYRNADELALVIDGLGQILINATSIEDLEVIERLAPQFDSFV